MTAQQQVRRYVKTGWPVASKTLDGCLRKSWSASKIPNLGLTEFTELLAAEGFRPRQYGIFWILRLGNDKVATVKGERGT